MKPVFFVIVRKEYHEITDVIVFRKVNQTCFFATPVQPHGMDKE
jgi:hypothetical protein